MVERRFQEAYLRDNLSFIRFAHVMGMVVWLLFWPLTRTVLQDAWATDLVIRLGVAVPSLLIGLGLTFTSWYRRRWQLVFSGVVLFSGLLWSAHRTILPEARPDWGYAGIMLALAFCYILSRLQFRYAAVTGALIVVAYNLITFVGVRDRPNDLLNADYFILAFTGIGMAAAYGLERFTRLLFLRERELDQQRQRADGLLHNILPAEIVTRLKGRDPADGSDYIAESYPRVTVLFADLVGSTQQASASTPTQMVKALDQIFSTFDELADRHALEKIKTIGDAYVAVSGTRADELDPVAAAADMALEILTCLEGTTWPGGGRIDVRIGLACGPAVAGVIGRKKFAWDLWGDTVNTASRLESQGTPGMIQVSEPTAELLGGRYRFSEPYLIDLKGKGPTSARFLLGPAEAVELPA